MRALLVLAIAAAPAAADEAAAMTALCARIPPDTREARGVACDAPACGWAQGVTCDGGAVTRIDMRGWGLVGTLPTEMGWLSMLTELDLRDNSLSGAIPVQLTTLTSLTWLALSRNSLSGTVPPEVGGLTSLTQLWLEHNDLRYPATASERDGYRQARRQCAPDGDAACLGIPAHSCTAFRDAALNLLDPSACVRCDGDYAQLWSLAAFVPLALLALVLLVAFAVRRPQEALQRSVSTVVLLLTHSQGISIIVSFSFKWPSAITQLLSFFSLNLLHLPQASCVLNVTNENQAGVGVYMIAALSACLLVLLAPLAVLAGAQIGALAAPLVDTSYMALSLILSLQLTFSWGVTHEALVARLLWEDASAATGGGADAQGNPLATIAFDPIPREQRDAATTLGALLIGLQLLLAVEFLRSIRSFQRGVERGEWLSGGLPCEGCAAAAGARGRVGELLAFAPQLMEHRLPRCHRLLQSLGACACGRREPIAPRRLARRVGFLTCRFAPHAPRWQLVVWARQLALLCVLVGSSVANVKLADESAAQKLVQLALGIVAILIVAIAWWAHQRTQPYAYRYQNVIEACLYGSTVTLLVLACIDLSLPDAMRTESAGGAAIEVLMLLVLLLPVLASVAYFVWRLRYDRHDVSDVDLRAALERADEVIDEPLRARLLDGSIRLLRCAWLLSDEADASLGRHEPSGAPLMRRRQELPEAAFMSAEEAVALLDRADRSIFVLSYRCERCPMPPPARLPLE